ncbi:MAG: phosphoribosylanthranilate isomerase [Cyanobacteria bacterium P01_G01_bin.54]
MYSLLLPYRVKICGITDLGQAQAIARLGVSTLGFICVARSPRYIAIEPLTAITRQLPETLQTVGVFVNAPLDTIVATVHQAKLTGIQLHGEEPPEFCQALRQHLPQRELIKAFRIRAPADLEQIAPYETVVETLLLDAYAPQAHGGTGQTLDWTSLAGFAPSRPWLLAGGLCPENLAQALAIVGPDGIDVSSGVERSPGDKDLTRVAALLRQLRVN